MEILKLKEILVGLVLSKLLLIDDKFNNHLPLDRQRKIMARSGLYVDTKTLFGLTDHVEKLLTEIPSMIRDELFNYVNVFLSTERRCFIIIKL